MDETKPDAGVLTPPEYGIVNIAWCPEHGLHGARTECHGCGGPVVQVPMIAVAEVPLTPPEYLTTGGLSHDEVTARLMDPETLQAERRVAAEEG